MNAFGKGKKEGGRGGGIAMTPPIRHHARREATGKKNSVHEGTNGGGLTRGKITGKR